MTTQVIPLTGLTDDQWLELRHPYLGASEIPVLTGDGYSGSTYWSLWREKRQAAPVRRDEVDDRMWFGKMLQPVFGQWLKMRRGWDIHERNCLLQNEDEGTSATMDFTASDAATGRKGIVIETKNRDRLIFNDRYDLDARGGKGDAWIYDKIQLSAQMRLAGAEHGCVAVLVGGNNIETFEYHRDELADIIDGIPEVTAEFWRRVEQNDEPKLEHTDIRQWALDRGEVHIDEPWLEFDAEIDDLCQDYARAKVEAKDATERKKAAETDLIAFMGQNKRAIGKGHLMTLKATLIPEKEITSVRKEYYKHTLKVEPRPANAADPLGPKLTVLDAG